MLNSHPFRPYVEKYQKKYLVAYAQIKMQELGNLLNKYDSIRIDTLEGKRFYIRPLEGDICLACTLDETDYMFVRVNEGVFWISIGGYKESDILEEVLYRFLSRVKANKYNIQKTVPFLDHLSFPEVAVLMKSSLDFF